MIKFRRNCKRGEGKSQGTTGAQKHENSLAYENFAAKIAPLWNEASSAKPFCSPRLPSAKSRSHWEKGLSLRNHFAAQAPYPAKIFAAAKLPFGTRVPFRSPNPHFATAKCLFATRVPFHSPILPFATTKCAAKMPLGCKIAFRLRNKPSLAKSLTVTQIPI